MMFPNIPKFNITMITKEQLNDYLELFDTIKENLRRYLYSFKKVIMSIGKNIIFDINHKSIVFDEKNNSYVGFFKHSSNHNNKAYEFFTNFAILCTDACIL